MEHREKVKAFVARIVQECKQEGLTIAETMSVPQLLRFNLESCVSEIHKKTVFTDFRDDE